ncbi:glycerate kinase type-2 family protein [Gracilimonas halophila]|uniref:Glycerate kinase n=1 Tax=Gracilimonas halophila TaxID=1834464 RepID=A0ABW5JJ82_9BACT
MKKKLHKQYSVLQEVAKKVVSGDFFQMNLHSYLDEIKSTERIWVLGAGKASVEMAYQVEQYFGSDIEDGIIISPNDSHKLNRVQVFSGTHPYPYQDSVSASYELRQFAKQIPDGATVIFCLSGGASSLLCIPEDGIELDELRHCYKQLLNSGASIHEINAVRKHLSETAGGKLGKLLAGTKLTSIVLSDVPGDATDVVGSGPTVADRSTFTEAFQVLKKYGLWDETPHSIRIYLSKGMHGDVPENPKPDNNFWRNHRVEVISGASLLAQNVAHFLSEEGYNVSVDPEAYNMDLNKISKKICGDAISVLSKGSPLKKPASYVYFGESTVNVKGEGKGGRNQELALNAAISIEGQHDISLLSLATDGVDGPTDAAGAIINSETTLKARKQKLSPEDYLQDNDSYHFHEEMKTLIKTGPTGNNLMDLQITLIG